MQTKEKKTGLNGTKKEKNYVIVDGKKISKTGAAMLKFKSNPGIIIVDMRAVLK
jgi:hypothetical protein